MVTYRVLSIGPVTSRAPVSRILLTYIKAGSRLEAELLHKRQHARHEILKIRRFNKTTEVPVWFMTNEDGQFYVGDKRGFYSSIRPTKFYLEERRALEPYADIFNGCVKWLNIVIRK